MLYNNEVRADIEKFAKRYKCQIEIHQDKKFLYLQRRGAFYELVFCSGVSEAFRSFCRLLRDYQYVFFPSSNDSIGIGSLDIIDGKRQQLTEQQQTEPVIKYSEEDVLS